MTGPDCGETTSVCGSDRRCRCSGDWPARVFVMSGVVRRLDQRGKSCGQGRAGDAIAQAGVTAGRGQDSGTSDMLGEGELVRIARGAVVSAGLDGEGERGREVVEAWNRAGLEERHDPRRGLCVAPRKVRFARAGLRERRMASHWCVLASISVGLTEPTDLGR